MPDLAPCVKIKGLIDGLLLHCVHSLQGKHVCVEPLKYCITWHPIRTIESRQARDRLLSMRETFLSEHPGDPTDEKFIVRAIGLFASIFEGKAPALRDCTDSPPS